MSQFLINEHGLWCPSCGECIASSPIDDEGMEPDECRCCGYPDADAVADYHVGDDEDCSNCAGEGVVYMCVEEYACVDPEGGCDLCERRCEWCGGEG